MNSAGFEDRLAEAVAEAEEETVTSAQELEELKERERLRQKRVVRA